MIDVTDTEARELYLAIFKDPVKLESEPDDWWKDVCQEMRQVVNAQDDSTAAKLIDWWHQEKGASLGTARSLRNKWNELHPDRKTTGGEIDGLVNKYLVLKLAGEGEPDVDVVNRKGTFTEGESRPAWCKRTWSFILSPEKDDIYGAASRAAMETYALVIENTNPKLAMEMLAKIAGIHMAMAKRGKGE
jgi:hypothetical protein